LPDEAISKTDRNCLPLGAKINPSRKHTAKFE
jgi:hypothetical protein